MERLILACLTAGTALAYGVAAHPAAAAPFCLTNQVMQPQCIYYDAQECSREAARQNAVCSANPAELPLSPNVGQYCVVTSSRASNCSYADRQTCDRAATQQNGTCVIAPTRQSVGAPDPYSPVNGY